MLDDVVQDELYFFCRDCNKTGYQPFLLSNTSGLEFYIKQTSGTTIPVCFVHFKITSKSQACKSCLLFCMRDLKQSVWMCGQSFTAAQQLS